MLKKLGNYKKFVLIILGILFALFVVEAVSQFIFFKLNNQMQNLKALPNYYYRISNNHNLAYELAPRFRYSDEKKKFLLINMEYVVPTT